MEPPGGPAAHEKQNFLNLPAMGNQFNVVKSSKNVKNRVCPNQTLKNEWF